jgi:hypothetical protein
MSTARLELPAELVEAIARRAAQLVFERLGDQQSSPWLTRRQAAAYLGLPVSRLEKDRCIPGHRDRGRVLYHRAELDHYFRALER